MKANISIDWNERNEVRFFGRKIKSFFVVITLFCIRDLRLILLSLSAEMRGVGGTRNEYELFHRKQQFSIFILFASRFFYSFRIGSRTSESFFLFSIKSSIVLRSARLTSFAVGHRQRCTLSFNDRRLNTSTKRRIELSICSPFERQQFQFYYIFFILLLQRELCSAFVLISLF